MQPIQFFHRRQLVSVSDVSPTRSVLNWLREDAACTGTKEGCNEGDCGACTVVVGTPQPNGEMALAPINSCIQFLPALHGKLLISVEDLAQEGKLHPCQRAMVECHGSQCGFCTPGFVMTLFAHYESKARAGIHISTREEIDDVLSGNLCRCTGYRPIIEAAQGMLKTAPQVRFDFSDAISALNGIAPLEYKFAGKRFIAPTTRAEFAAARLAHPDARVLAGSTDVGLWATKQFRTATDTLYIGNVADLQHVALRENALHIGAAVSLERAFAAIAKDVVPQNESWRELWLRFASPLIRNAGTLAGNIANGSPIGDSMPALIALGANIVLQKGDAVREMALEDFYLAYQKTALQTGEFVAEIIIPAAQFSTFRTYKISKRFDQDISAVCFAGALEIVENKVSRARIAYGGMAATPKRATHVEAALVGSAWNEATARAAMAALPQDFLPLTDMRASKEYRMQVAQNLLLRWWHETNANAPKTAPQVSVRFVERAL
jgi:xanthine dehydrogenase small subunit